MFLFMVDKLSLEDISINGKRVLMRVDFNVPLDDEGKITDDSRIQAALRSIRYVLEHEGRLILMSHLGRPKGKVDKKLSLTPVAKHLEKLIGKKVVMAPDCVGEEVEKLSYALKPEEVLLLENLRFHKEETKPLEYPYFSQQLARLGDIYVNDAFGTAHRYHASTADIAQYFPGKAVAGFLMKKEIDYLSKTFCDPKRPFYSIIGGAKVSSKIGVLNALVKKVDALLIGGAMAYTFLKAKGFEVGNSLVEEDQIEVAQKILKNANVEFFLPVDHVITKDMKSGDQTIVSVDQGIPKGYLGVDIGPETIKYFSSILQKAKTIFWNGPLGVFENPLFSKGTFAIAKVLSHLDAITVVGGGDSVAAIKKQHLDRAFTHVSTGGGACLEYIEKGRLPGIEVLSSKLTES